MDWITLTHEEVNNDALPELCVHCGRPAAHRRNETFAWAPTWVGLLYYLGYVPGAVASSYFGRDMRVSLPVCQEHHEGTKHWFWLYFGWFLFPGFLALVTFLAIFAWQRYYPVDDSQVAALQNQQQELNAELDRLLQWEGLKGIKGEDFLKQGKKGGATFGRPELDRAWQLMIQNEKATVDKHVAVTQEMASQQQELHDLIEFRSLALPIGPAIAAVTGLFVWLISLAFILAGPKAIEVQEINDTGISLVNLADGFVKAVRDARHNPKLTPPAQGFNPPLETY